MITNRAPRLTRSASPSNHHTPPRERRGDGGEGEGGGTAGRGAPKKPRGIHTSGHSDSEPFKSKEGSAGGGTGGREWEPEVTEGGDDTEVEVDEEGDVEVLDGDGEWGTV